MSYSGPVEVEAARRWMNGTDEQLGDDLSQHRRRHRNPPVFDAVIDGRQLKTERSMQSDARGNAAVLFSKL